MSDGQKTPLAQSLNTLASKRINDSRQLLGKALPCSVTAVSGAIVTVKFEIQSNFTLPETTMPLFGPEYIRYPIQPGCKGLAIPAAAFLGGMSGLGGGVADLSIPGNLSALVFFPIGNTDWSTVDPDAVTIYGPNGVVLRNDDSDSTLVLTPSSIILTGEDFVKLVSGGGSVTVHSNGNFEVTGSGVGSVHGNTLTLSDAAHSTTATQMFNAWAAMVTWVNAHTHTSATPGNPTSAPIVPYSGGSIAT